jgi:tetratricopeptide (TPR) repeat protein
MASQNLPVAGLGVAHTLYNLGDIYQEMGKFDEAVECHRHALRILDRAGDRWGQAHALTFLGVSLGRSTASRARCSFERTLETGAGRPRPFIVWLPYSTRQALPQRHMQPGRLH